LAAENVAVTFCHGGKVKVVTVRQDVADNWWSLMEVWSYLSGCCLDTRYELKLQFWSSSSSSIHAIVYLPKQMLLNFLRQLQKKKDEETRRLQCHGKNSCFRRIFLEVQTEIGNNVMLKSQHLIKRLLFCWSNNSNVPSCTWSWSLGIMLL
jgi:hypothetical protein